MGLVDQSGKPVMMITDITPTTLETCCYYFFFYIFSIWVFLLYAIFLSFLFFLKYWALLPFSKYIVYFLSCTISFLVKILILFFEILSPFVLSKYMWYSSLPFCNAVSFLLYHFVNLIILKSFFSNFLQYSSHNFYPLYIFT